MTEPTIPLDTQLRFVAIHQRHLTDDFNYYKKLLRAYEDEFIHLWIAISILGLMNIVLAYKLTKLEGRTYNGNTT